MDFTISDEQAMFAETARTLFDDSCTSARLRALMESGEARDEERWQAIAKQRSQRIAVT